jgi:ribosome-associated protein
MLSVSPRIQIPLDEFEFTFARSGGPGGQNVNKVNSKAQLRWSVTRTQSLPADVLGRFLMKYANRLTTDGDLILTSQKYRDQPRNMDDCLEKLRILIAAVATPPKRRRPTKPTAASKKRRIESKRQKSKKKQQRRHPLAED